MKFFSKISKNLFSIFQTALIVLLVVLIAVFVGVLSFEYVEEHTSELLDLPSKNETLKFLGIGMGGVLIALQALMSYKRAKAMEQTAEAQADAARAQADAVSKTEQGQRQDRLKNAIEHLGHEKESVRLGGAYELFHLAEDTENLRQTVFDILCAHIRRTTSENEYRKTYRSKPSEEVQSILNLLFMENPEIFKSFSPELDGTWLNGSYFGIARLEAASLAGAYLQNTLLVGAHLQGAVFENAHLQAASFDHAYLREACFDGAHLQGTILDDAHLQGASFIGAHLQEASLIRTDLRGARSYESHNERTKTTMELVKESEFAQVIANSIDQESDLSGAIFRGGLSQKDCDSCVKGLPDEIAEELRKDLEPHIGKPKSNQLPKDSHAITGSYTKEEAEQWIAEYEQAMSEVPEDDS